MTIEETQKLKFSAEVQILNILKQQKDRTSVSVVGIYLNVTEEKTIGGSEIIELNEIKIDMRV